MYLGESHVGTRTRVDFLMQEFETELDGIVKLHRYVIMAAARDFNREYNLLLSKNAHEDSAYDGGDAIWDAEKILGINPWNVEHHLGLLSLSRAVSLAEIVLARLAATCWERPELTVFPNGKTWPRGWERAFYKTCLKNPFDPNKGGLGTLRALRDLYVHGYGVPVKEEQQHKLAGALHREFGVEPASPEEVAHGYKGVASFFGEHARFDPQEGLRDDMYFGLPQANVTPLATYRALRRIGDRVSEAARAVMTGPLDDASSSKFIQVVEDWWQKHGGIPERP